MFNLRNGQGNIYGGNSNIMDKKKKKERQLSKEEQKRKEDFEKLTEQLVAEGYKSNHITMGVVAANVCGIFASLPFITLFVVLYFVMGNEIQIEVDSKQFLLADIVFLIMLFVLTIAHELIHGITWSLFVKNGWKSISFGFIKEYLTPYCSCNQPMKKHQIIIGALMPTIFLGFLPGVAAVFTGSLVLLLVAIFMILAGSGDLVLTMKLLQYKTLYKDVLFIDHPYELGTVVFER